MFSSFADKELKRYGWSNEKGLGKHENGIKAPIKVSFKNDTVGLGVDKSEEFTVHWWDHIFNKTAKSLKVKTSSSGDVSVEKTVGSSSGCSLSYRRKGKQSENGKPLLYGHFVQSNSTYTNGKEISHHNDAALSSDEDDRPTETDSSLSVMDKVYKSTGLTGHKAARHGHTLSGKLKRVRKHEKDDHIAVSAKRSQTIDPCSSQLDDKYNSISDSKNISERKANRDFEFKQQVSKQKKKKKRNREST